MAKCRSCTGLPVVFLISSILLLSSCGGGTQGSQPPQVEQTPPPNNLTGVLMWKGDSSGKGLFAGETTLTTVDVNVNQFGRIASFKTDGLLMAQPLYIHQLDMVQGGTHNVIILATENDTVYAIDADNPGTTPLWQRAYLDSTKGITPAPDTSKAIGGQVGITGTPFLDPKTATLYFVTAISNNGAIQHWLRSIDVRTGQDVGAGSVQVQASVAGDGKSSVNGQIAFDPTVELQRFALNQVNGSILVGWGSFSDWNVYHGWLMAFDPTSLALQAVFNPTTQYQAVDDANGPSDHGGGGSLWAAGAGPAIDAQGNIYVNTANGSFNADSGGNNYGDTMLRLNFLGNSFQVMDYFTPSSKACMDFDDLELGAGGVALLPSDFTNGTNLAVALTKEGRIYLVNTSNMGKFNSASDQVIQEFMVGDQTCSESLSGETEGPGWNRLYGNASYWNGNIYAGASSLPLRQYQFQNGVLNQSPIASSPTAYGLRGANTVVSANGTQNGIVWANEKQVTGTGVLHAYDATNVSTELWNSAMNQGRDALGEGIAFSVPVVADGKVIVTYDTRVGIFGELQ